MRSMTSRLMPYASLPISASPESLSRMRRYAGAASGWFAAFGTAASVAAFGGFMRNLRQRGFGSTGSASIPFRSSHRGLLLVYAPRRRPRHLRHLVGEIILPLRDAFADDINRERVHRCALRLQQLGNRLLAVALH